jgi:hypothetical protein
MRKIYYTTILALILLTSCSPSAAPTLDAPKQSNNIVAVAETTATTQPQAQPQPQAAFTSQPIPLPTTLGPDEFPQGYNPLTGQRVVDPSLLDIPAVLVSISHFPPVARPQAGFSFAPFVYEYFITEGSTRHLAVFYGEDPAPEIPVHGDCKIRKTPFTQTKLVLGNRVWYDTNQNGMQDPGENGVGGICVNLYDASNNVIQQTTTDSNGYYAFNVDAGQYVVEFVKPSWLEFTQKNVGDETQDSDVDQASGRADALDVNAPLLYLDAGLIPNPDLSPTPDPSATLPAPEIGPVRSGRLVYRFLGGFYQYSCLIYASADPDVLAEIPGCATVPHTASGGGAMLPLERMHRIAAQNSKDISNFNYTSNLFSEEAPAGGKPAQELDEYWARLNQSKWVYDAASGAWWRYVDQSSEETAGVLNPLVDRLNNRQVMAENVIVIFAEHTVVTPTIVDINLAIGEKGNAYLFRDGQMYDIQWSTRAGKYETTTGLRRPMQFINADGTPAKLKPGHTWVVVFNLQSYLEDQSNGIWRARFVAPQGAK